MKSHGTWPWILINWAPRNDSTEEVSEESSSECLRDELFS